MIPREIEIRDERLTHIGETTMVLGPHRVVHDGLTRPGSNYQVLSTRAVLFLKEKQLYTLAALYLSSPTESPVGCILLTLPTERSQSLYASTLTDF